MQNNCILGCFKGFWPIILPTGGAQVGLKELGLKDLGFRDSVFLGLNVSG